jgi:two-component system cell cycle sensor histidine kinase/response regulator CckA
MNANSPPAVDRVERAASPALLLALAVVLCGAVAAFLLLPPAFGIRAISFIIALLAIFGVFSILLYAFGQLQFAGRASRFDVTKAIADGNSDGLIVTDADSRIVYANEAYRIFSHAKGAADLKLVERLFTGAPEVSEAVYRLAQAARGGKSAVEELRMAPPLAGEGAAAWYRIRVRPLDGLSRFGRSATSPASASATRASSRTCSTRSTTSTTRRPASSPPIRMVRSPI